MTTFQGAIEEGSPVEIVITTEDGKRLHFSAYIQSLEYTERMAALQHKEWPSINPFDMDVTFTLEGRMVANPIDTGLRFLGVHECCTHHRKVVEEHNEYLVDGLWVRAPFDPA